jgi:hypothetical protein
MSSRARCARYSIARQRQAEAKVGEGVEVIEVIEGTSLPLLDHLDTLAHLCLSYDRPRGSSSPLFVYAGGT